MLPKYFNPKVPFLILFVLITRVLFGQEGIPPKSLSKYLKFCNKEITKNNTKTAKINKTFLKKYFRAENSLFRKMCKENPDLADYYFSYAVNPLYYHQKHPEKYIAQNKQQLPIEYNSTLDTLNNSLSYLNLKKNSAFNLNDYSKANTNLNKSKELSNQTSIMQSYFRDRKSMLKDCTTKFPALKNNWLKYDETNYYYHEMTNKISKQFLNKIRSNDFADNILSTNKEFLDFVSNNSSLKDINKIPSDWGKDIGSLQTNTFSKNMVNKTVSSIKNMDKLVTDEIKPMHETLNKLKNSRGITNAADAPSFKPNPMKSKSFSERLNFDFDFQINKSKDFYPISFSLGGSIGYKLTKRLIWGLGITNLFSLGKSWNNRQFESTENGYRVYIDYSIKKFLFAEFACEKSFLETKKENSFSSHQFFDSYMGGLKYIKKVSGKLSFTFSLLYNFQYSQLSPAKGPLVYKVGWQF